jgi:glycosyltransferase involved in cell wall biosynthesis
MQEASHCFFNLESPLSETTLNTARQRLQGWVVPKQGTHLVDLRARIGSVTFPGVLGFPRIDLAQFFESQRAWLPAGFAIDVFLNEGKNNIELETLSLNGEWLPLASTSYSLQSNSTGSRPIPDPLTPEEFQTAFQIARTESTEKSVRSIPFPRIIYPGDLPFHGYVSAPASLAPALYGQMEVSGWLFHTQQEIRRVLATADLLIFQPLELGGEFPGVRERFTDQAYAGNCRFSGVISVSEALPDPASIRIYAELADGSTHLCIATQCRCISTEQLKAVAPPPSLIGAFIKWKSLKTKMISRGIRLAENTTTYRGFLAAHHVTKSLARTSGSHSVPPPLPAASEKPLRLLLITHNLNLEGAPLLFSEYARHLAQHRNSSIQVISGQDGPLRSAFNQLKISVHIVDSSAILKCNSPARLNEILRTRLPELNWQAIDLVVANTVACFWGVQLARLQGKPSLLYIHESTPPHLFQALPRALLPAVAKSFENATAVSFNTPATRDYYAGLGNGKNFYLNAGWIDLSAIDAFRAEHPRASLRAQLGLRADELLVANIGTVCARKGQHDFLRTIEWMMQSRPDLGARCRFVMIGGRNTRYNELLARDLEASGLANVHIISETTHAFHYFGAADLFVCTSYEESFPRVVLEAMAFSVPIVSTEVHGISYMLRANQDAILVRPADTAALASGICKLLDNPSHAIAMSQSARSRVAEFDAAHLLPRHADFTSQVVAVSV